MVAIKNFNCYVYHAKGNINPLSKNIGLTRGLMRFHESKGNKNVSGLLKWMNDMATLQVCTI